LCQTPWRFVIIPYCPSGVVTSVPAGGLNCDSHPVILIPQSENAAQLFIRANNETLSVAIEQRSSPVANIRSIKFIGTHRRRELAPLTVKVEPGSPIAGACVEGGTFSLQMEVVGCGINEQWIGIDVVVYAEVARLSSD
jgi:hypothetical protein